jgi:[acyl-carrier-protein] S-malonyltransferase
MMVNQAPMRRDSYIFPGQGSQHVGMAAALAAAYPVARDTFAQADEILGFPLSALCFSGPIEELTDTRNAQPAILTASIAALRALQTERPDLDAPSFVAGHSLGEYSALVAAGALEYADAVSLTRTRGELMARAGERSPGSMAAVLRLGDRQVAEICTEASRRTDHVVQVANYNSPGQVVISGSEPGIAAAAELATASGGRVRPLAVSIASHSALMAPAADSFAEHVEATPFRPPRITIVGNVTAEPLADAVAIRRELVAQLTSSVRWTESIRFIKARGVSRFIEVGPGQVLVGLVKRIEPEVLTASVAEPGDLANL